MPSPRSMQPHLAPRVTTAERNAISPHPARFDRRQSERVPDRSRPRRWDRRDRRRRRSGRARGSGDPDRAARPSWAAGSAPGRSRRRSGTGTGHHEPRLPRVLPPVLQPPRPAPPGRPRAGEPDAGAGLPAGRSPTDTGTRSPRSRGRRRSTWPPSWPRARASGPPTSPRSTTKSVWELLDVDFPPTFSDHDGESASAFLDRLRFPDEARHLALEVFARSFFARPEDFSAGELVGMFHSYFLGSSEGLLFDVPVDDYDTVFWAPLGDYLERLGVRGADLGADRDAGLWTTTSVSVQTETARLSADTAVLATDLRTTRRLVASPTGRSTPTGGARIAETVNAPRFAVWRLWLDRRVNADRPAFLGTSGYGADGQRHRARAVRGRRSPVVATRTTPRSSRCTRTPCRPGTPTRRRSGRRCAPSWPGSTRRPRRPPMRRRGVAGRGRLSRWSARPPGSADPRSPRPTPGWCWRATGSAATTRWP